MAIRATGLISAVLGLLVFAGIVSAAAQDRPAERKANVSPAQDFPVATDVRLGGDDKQTRFVVDLTQKIDIARLHAGRSLPGGDRPAADQSSSCRPRPANRAAGWSRRSATGWSWHGGSRIVLDTKRPVRVEKAFVLDAADGQPARLVLDLAATDRATFLRAIAAVDNRLPREAAQKAEPTRRRKQRRSRAR